MVWVGPISLRGKPGPPGRDGEDGDSPALIPGQQGRQGIPGQAVVGLAGDDGEDPIIIPGPRGFQGSPGQTIPGWPGEDGEDAFHIPGAAGLPGVSPPFVPGTPGEDGEDGTFTSFAVGNLTGPIASSGNVTTITSQTGTGTKFVVDTQPTIIAPTVTNTAGATVAIATFTTPSMSNGNRCYIDLGSANSSNNGFSILYNHNSSSSSRYLAIQPNEAGIGSGFVITADLNVGFGTATPAYKFSSYSTSGVYQFGLGNVSQADGKQLRLGYDYIDDGGIISAADFGTTIKPLFLQPAGGNIGVQQLIPTASMDLPASTTAAASLRIRSGTAPTSPNDGDIWYDGTNLKIRVGGTTKTVTIT